ncbi:hypothetical protein B0H12DRAFT_1170528 [Mycena haematopus]|nr:hypothetical protein B0H12DRAFT_1170528 [Mycena haematopus]
MFSLTKLTLATLALVGATYAQTSSGGLSLLVPGGPNLWWLAAQPNNIIWTCGESTFTDFTVWINNSDTTLISAITPLIAIEQNFNCALLVTADLVTMPIGTGYTIVMTDPSNATNVYATSAPFEIKALTAGYPASSATPVDQASATVSKGSASNVGVSQTGSPSGTGSGSAPAKTNVATVSTRVGMTAVALVGVAVAAAALL